MKTLLHITIDWNTIIENAISIIILIAAVLIVVAIVNYLWKKQHTYVKKQEAYTAFIPQLLDFSAKAINLIEQVGTKKYFEAEEKFNYFYSEEFTRIMSNYVHYFGSRKLMDIRKIFRIVTVETTSRSDKSIEQIREEIEELEHRIAGIDFKSIQKERWSPNSKQKG